MVPQQLSQHTHATQDRSPEGCRLLYGRVVPVLGFRFARILPVLLTPSFLFQSAPFVPRQFLQSAPVVPLLHRRLGLALTRPPVNSLTVNVSEEVMEFQVPGPPTQRKFHGIS